MAHLKQIGGARPKIIKAVQEVRAEYSPLEIRSWVDGYDVVAIQEADPAFREALGAHLGPKLVRGDDDRDGRGIQVESCSALLIHPDSGIRVLSQERALLQFPARRRGRVSREMVVALVERESDGQRLVLCSVHIHPPQQVENAGADYIKYLRPLGQALQAAAGVGPDQVPCLVLGDLNVSPEEFAQRTAGDDFWRQLQASVPEGGNTAYPSNPNARGDFALCSGGTWSGRSLGSEDFGSFERYAREVTKAAQWRMQLPGGAASMSSLVRAEEAEGGPRLGTRRLGARIPSEAGDSLTTTRRCLERALKQAGDVRHRKGLLTSDHRPLSFIGWLGEAVPSEEPAP